MTTRGILLAEWVPDFFAWQPADWTALAAWVTAVIALAAGIFAFRQVGEARQLREEQARPYVMTYMESSTRNPQIIELVIRNFGGTAAHDVVVSCSPRLERSTGAEPEAVWIPEVVPLLAPDQEWRTMWDFAPRRVTAGLPDRHEVSSTYRDSKDKPHTTHALLDWSAFNGRRWVKTYTMHDAAESLRNIEATMRNWQEGIHGGLAVYVRDGDAQDRPEPLAMDEWQTEGGAEAGQAHGDGLSDA